MNGVGLVVVLLVVGLVASLLWLAIPRFAYRSRRRSPDPTLTGLARAVAAARAEHDSLQNETVQSRLKAAASSVPAPGRR